MPKKLVFIFLLAVAASAYGEPQAAPSVPHRGVDLGDTADGIVGLVVNGTVTPNGYEFYKLFTILWSEKPESRQYSLHIEERLSKRYGNQVTVYWGQKSLFTSVLPLKYDALKKLCEDAVEKTQGNIAAFLIERAPDETDIAREEI